MTAGSFRAITRRYATTETEKLAAPAFPKPSQIRRKRPAVNIYPDGREVCSKSKAGQAEYFHRTEFMFERDNGICCICHEPIDVYDYPTFEHKGGRGMGGSRRDDRPENNGVAHWECNAELGSKHLAEQSLDTDLCLDCDSAACLCSYEGGAL